MPSIRQIRKRRPLPSLQKWARLFEQIDRGLKTNCDLFAGGFGELVQARLQGFRRFDELARIDACGSTAAGTFCYVLRLEPSQGFVDFAAAVLAGDVEALRGK